MHEIKRRLEKGVDILHQYSHRHQIWHRNRTRTEQVFRARGPRVWATCGQQGPHWCVENQLHWTLDVIFREDESRIRRDHAPANFNTLGQFSLNLLKRSVPSMSVRQKKYKAGWDDDFRAKILFER